MKVIVDIPENKFKDHDGSIDLYYMAGALANGMLIPDDATNGDMFVAVWGYAPSQLRAYVDWWNAPYKKGDK